MTEMGNHIQNIDIWLVISISIMNNGLEVVALSRCLDWLFPSHAQSTDKEQTLQSALIGLLLLNGTIK